MGQVTLTFHYNLCRMPYCMPYKLRIILSVQHQTSLPLPIGFILSAFSIVVIAFCSREWNTQHNVIAKLYRRACSHTSHCPSGFLASHDPFGKCLHNNIHLMRCQIKVVGHMKYCVRLSTRIERETQTQCSHCFAYTKRKYIPEIRVG